MSPKLRAKLASSLNNIEKPEDWKWNRWLRPPGSESWSISLPKVSVINKKVFSSWISEPGNDGFVFDTIETPVTDNDVFFKQLKIHSTKSLRFVIPLQKSVRIFFSIVQTKVSKNNFKNKLETGKFNSILIERNINPPVIKIVEENVTPTIIKNLFSSKSETVNWKYLISENLFTANFPSTEINTLGNFHLINIRDIVPFNLIQFIDPALVTDSLIPDENNVIIRDIVFNYNIYLFKYLFDAWHYSITGDLLSTDSATQLIDDKHLTRYYLNVNNSENVTCNLISYQYLTKFIEVKYLERYFFNGLIPSDNLLPDSSNIEMLSDFDLQRYYFTETEISNELLSIIPDNFDVTLLNSEDFDVKVLELENTDIEPVPIPDRFKNTSIVLSSDNKKSQISETFLEKFSISRKHIHPVQIPDFSSSEITKNLCYRQLLYKIPKVTNIDNTDVSTAKILSTSITSLFNFDEEQVSEFDVNEFPELMPLSEIDINKQIESFSPLYEYQKQGVEFLINNQFAILVDDPGLGKTVQSICALRILFKIGLVRSVLILCPSLEYGSSELSMISGKSDGWEGHFFHWAPELTVKVINGDEGQRRIDWYDYAQVFIVSLKTLNHDIRKKIIHYDRLKIFNCLILDDIRSFKEDFSENKKIFESLNLNYLWILNDFPFDYHLDEMICKIKPMVDEGQKGTLEKYYTPKAEIPATYLRRQKNELLNFLPQKSSFDKWIELHDEQKAEYDYALDSGIKKISDSLETGNILLIQPQIFNLLHQLMQICNYPTKGNKSGKEDVLLNQLDTIIQNREKAIILSQYEKQGIKKLEELLNREKIGFVTHQSGMSESVLIKNIKDFNSKDNTCAFIVDIKALKGVINIGSVNNIIHFDHWWSPLSIWQVEDKIATGNSRKNLNIYTYWTLNTVEEKIYRKLAKKGLFVKGVVESFSSMFFSEMINTDEWLEIIGVQEENPESNEKYAKSAFEKINSIPDEVFREMGKSFLSKLGYSSSKFMTYVDSSGKDIDLTSKVVNNREETIIVKFIHSPVVEADKVSEFVNTISNYRNISKNFLITSGVFSQEARQYTTYKSDKLYLIDGINLSNYLVHYNLI